jgi:hypothetical protein
LTVISLVTNDNGGKLQPNNFKIIVSGVSNPNPATFQGNSQGTIVSFSNEGLYNTTQNLVKRYNINYTGDCVGFITVGQKKTCTITANDEVIVTSFGALSYIRVINNVINDDGGTKQPSDFTIAIKGSNPSPSTFAGETSPGTIAEMSKGSYQVIVETPDPGYETTYSVGCSGSIGIGESGSCVITNNDKSNGNVPKEVSAS